MTYTLADRGLNTTIDVRDLNTGAASRHGISSQSRREWRRRRIIDERSKTRKSRERNLVKANQFIRDRSQLPVAMQEEVARLYRRLSDKGTSLAVPLRGCCCCTYLVAREENVPRQIPDIAEQFSIEEKELSRLIRQVSRMLNMHSISSPTNTSIRSCRNSNCSIDAKSGTAFVVCHQATRGCLARKKPMGVLLL